MEPQAPPPPPQPAAAPPQKKKMGPLGWTLIGCGGILLLGALAFVALGVFAVNKTKSFVEEMAENPVRTAAETAVRLNPHLDLVDADDEAQTLTIRDNRSGEEATFDWSEIAEGRFSFESSEGASMRIDATGGEGGVITMTDDEGAVTQTISHEGSDLPDWFPAYPGASKASSTFSSESGGTRTEMFSFTVDATVGDLMEWYEGRMGRDGYSVSRSTYSNNGVEGGNLTGKADDGKRSLTLAFNETDQGTQVGVSFSERP